MQYETLIETLTEAVAAYYIGDASTAGLVVAKLGRPAGPIPGGWYASIARYREPLGRGKLIVCSVEAGTLRDALVQVATKWQMSCEPAVNGLGAVGKMLERFPK